MNIGKWTFDTEHEVYIMGILNVTPDSFSDGGKYDELDQALLLFEKGIKLSKACQRILDHAEQKVTRLTQTADGDMEEEPFV